LFPQRKNTYSRAEFTFNSGSSILKEAHKFPEMESVAIQVDPSQFSILTAKKAQESDREHQYKHPKRHIVTRNPSEDERHESRITPQ